MALTTASNQGLKFEELPYCTAEGVTLPGSLDRYAGQDITALVIQQPNFFGCLEDVDALTDWAHAHGALVIAVVNPTSLALLKPPGEWGAQGRRHRVGEGQPLGVPLSSGGPYFGFMTTRMEHVRQMPGRIVGRTLDVDGRAGLHAHAAGARAAHPPRQGDLQHLHQPGPADDGGDDLPVAHGRRRDSRASPLPATARTRELVGALSRVPGVQPAFSGGRTFTKRCCSSIGRWRRCSRRSPRAASSAGSTSAAITRSSATRCWCAPPRPRRSADIERYRGALTETLQPARAA